MQSRRPLVGLAVALFSAFCVPGTGNAQDSPLARLSATLSEPGGSFDTDNLISNEASYLHVLGAMDRLGVRGGGYIGVGPDQNFSYIAAVRPEIAYLVDVRRDNLLLHLLFRALFLEAPTRIEYLALLYGRPAPPRPSEWQGRSAAELAAWIDGRGALPDQAAAVRRRAAERIGSFGFRLDARDLSTVDRFHRAFIGPGLDLQFTSTGRAPSWFYPTHRDLVLALDRAGTARSFLASESGYGFVRRMQQDGRVVPVVGDLSGPHAMEAIGRDLRTRGLTVSALYVSNVEYYLFGSGTFSRYARAVEGLPRDRRSVVIRSWFQRGGLHPQAVAGFGSTQVLQTLDAFVAGLGTGYRSYWDLATRDPVPPA